MRLGSAAVKSGISKYLPPCAWWFRLLHVGTMRLRPRELLYFVGECAAHTMGRTRRSRRVACNIHPVAADAASRLRPGNAPGHHPPQVVDQDLDLAASARMMRDVLRQHLAIIRIAYGEEDSSTRKRDVRDPIRKNSLHGAPPHCGETVAAGLVQSVVGLLLFP